MAEAGVTVGEGQPPRSLQKSVLPFITSRVSGGGGCFLEGLNTKKVNRSPFKKHFCSSIELGKSFSFSIWYYSHSVFKPLQVPDHVWVTCSDNLHGEQTLKSGYRQESATVHQLS